MIKPEQRSLTERLHNPIRPTMIDKKYKNLGFRASFSDMEKIDELCDIYDMDKSQLFRYALDELYKRSIKGEGDYGKE